MYERPCKDERFEREERVSIANQGPTVRGISLLRKTVVLGVALDRSARAAGLFVIGH